ncbi:MAG: sialate O-acetylesterase [Verrucomicrobiae bacterium]
MGLLALSSSAWAEVKPNPLFTDGAVLQQGIEVPVWGTANDGEKVTVTFDGQNASTVAKDGRWMVRLKPHKAGGPFSLAIAGENTVTANNVLVGEVWVCSGQSNMAFSFSGADTAATEAPKADYPKLRMFTVPNKTAVEPMAEAAGSWVECTPENVKRFSAVGYFFGRDIHKATGLPVGMIHTSWGGTPAQAWTSLGGLEKDPELAGYVTSIKALVAAYPEAKAKYPQAMEECQAKLKIWNEECGNAYNETLKAWAEANKKAKAEGRPETPKPQPAKPKPNPPALPEGGPGTPTVLYNAMVAPLLPYAIKGAIWYQGESNAGKSKEYQTLFPRMIADWREKWGVGEFPFLFVQIAPFNGQPPEIREAQLLTLKKVPNTGMAVTTDVGSATDIHPKQKEPVGARLALAARALAYGEKIEYSGPIFEGLKIEGARALVSFKHVGGGLVAKDGKLKGFTIAGADKKFVPAKAEIKADTVVVSSPDVAAPVAVRYGWANVPDVNLFNKEGLPASPFRTDVE